MKRTIINSVKSGIGIGLSATVAYGVVIALDKSLKFALRRLGKNVNKPSETPEVNEDNIVFVEDAVE